MKLVVKNGFLIDKDEKYKCSIGYNGLSNNKSEGDGCTPIGTFKINKILFLFLSDFESVFSFGSAKPS